MSQSDWTVKNRGLKIV